MEKPLGIIDPDEVEKEKTKVQANGQIQLSKEERAALDLQPDDIVKKWTVKEKKFMVLMNAKHAPRDTVEAMFGWLLKSVFIVAIVLAPLLTIPAYGQQPGVTAPPVDTTLPPDQQPIDVTTSFGSPETITLPNAYLPFKIDISYPTGINATFNVEKISPSSSYYQIENAGGPVHVRTIIVNASSDTFTFTIGDSYNFFNNQIVSMVATGNNGQIMSHAFPINGESFILRYVVTTVPAPHIPTADELNAGIYQRLDVLSQQVAGSTQAVENLEDSLGPTLLAASNALQAAVLPLILGSISLIAGTVVIWQVSRSRKLRRAEIGPAPAPVQPRAAPPTPPEGEGLLTKARKRLI